MKKIPRLYKIMLTLLSIVFIGYNCTDNNKSKEGEVKNDGSASGQNGAFQNHRDSIPPDSIYNGPLFELSHDYPGTFTSPVNSAWQQLLKGSPVNESNAFAYMAALKEHIKPKIVPFFTDHNTWTPAKFGWFNEPWLGSQREAILGTYQGNGNPKGMFTTLNENEAGYVLTLYDSVAAYTVGQIWGQTGQKVNLVNNAAQFKEGSIIVKLAFSNINYPQWSVMKGAQVLNIYDTTATSAMPNNNYALRPVSFFQMDVIVKDSIAAPKTGWVYSTFVYDQSITGSFWEQMVPLGAMWGNDPGVNSPITPPYPALSETVINPKAPAYSTQTLGWGGRLSGPNDGAVAQEAVDINTGTVYKNLALSSCMSCHSPAQDNFNAFLLPGPFPTSDTLFVYTPGSAKWNLWFRDNWGTVPFDSGQVAMDYDMVMAFKSVPAFNAAQPGGQQKLTNIMATAKYRKHKSGSLFWH